MRRRDRPSIAWLVARDTPAPVAAQVLEEWIGGRVRRPSQVQGGKGPVGVRKYLIPRHNPIGIVCSRKQSSGSKEKEKYQKRRAFLANHLVADLIGDWPHSSLLEPLQIRPPSTSGRAVILD